MIDNVSVFLVLIPVLFFASCAASGPKQVKSQVEIRQLQTKTFDTNDYKRVLKAMLNVLQDDEYIIENANVELGFLKAEKETDVETRWGKFARAMDPENARYAKLNVIEASCNVTRLGNKTKVRANFQIKLFNQQNELVYSHQIEDEKFYTEFFFKVDKAIFLESEEIL